MEWSKQWIMPKDVMRQVTGFDYQQPAVGNTCFHAYGLYQERL